MAVVEASWKKPTKILTPDANKLLQSLGDGDFAAQFEELFKQADTARSQLFAFMDSCVNYLSRGQGAKKATSFKPNNKAAKDAWEKCFRQQPEGTAESPRTLKDIVRGTIQCEDVIAIAILRDWIKSQAPYTSIDPGKQASALKDRFSDPKAYDPNNGGMALDYVDCKFFLVFNVGGKGHACELQLTTPQLAHIKEEFAHPIYEILRQGPEQPTDGWKGYTLAADQVVKLAAKMFVVYQAATDGGKTSPPKGVFPMLYILPFATLVTKFFTEPVKPGAAQPRVNPNSVFIEGSELQMCTKISGEIYKSQTNDAYATGLMAGNMFKVEVKAPVAANNTAATVKPTVTAAPTVKKG